MRYQMIDTLTGAILNEQEANPALEPLRYKPRGRVGRPKKTYRQRQTDIHLSHEMAWTLGIAIFLLGVWFAH